MIITTKLRNEANFPFDDANFVTAPLARLSGYELAWPLNYLLGKVQLIFLALWRLSVIWRARSLSLVHAHYSFMGWDYLWLVDYLSLPLVVSFYGYDYERLPRREPIWNERYSVLFRRADLFVTEGEHGRRKLIAMGCPADKVEVVHLGVEPGLIPVFPRRKAQRSLRLVQVATFTEKKGYDTTVHAFAKAVGSCPGMTLTLVGKDPEGERRGIEELIQSYGLEDCISIIDGVDFNGLHEFLAGFDVFIHPSRYSISGDSEGGAPVVLLDAQATGLPVIATDHCDIPDEVIHGKTGLLAAEGDVESLARHIECFYFMDDEAYRWFCDSARRHVEEHYDAAKSGIRLRQLYQEILDKRARQRTV